MASSLDNPLTTTLAGLRGKIRATVERHVPPGTPVALVDYPNHGNVGDCAIWLGEVAYLAATDCAIRYRCDLVSYDPSRLRASLGTDGIVLMHGGGNFGDLWPLHQRFRERLLSDLEDYRIVVFPQTIYFRNRSLLNRARSAIAQHPRLTIISRDAVSQSFALSHFDCNVDIAPDMALWLPTSGRTQSPERDLVWIARTDLESLNPSAGRARTSPDAMDWLELDTSSVKLGSWMAQRSLKRITGLLSRKSPLDGIVSRLQTGLFNPVAAAHYQRGRQLLSAGNVVLADRLHAHLLCLLMGIPHVLVDNNYGKLKNFWTTWTAASTITRWAPNWRTGEEIARNLI